MKKSERIKNFSRFLYSNVLYCYRCHRQHPKEYPEAYRSGHNEPHSKRLHNRTKSSLLIGEREIVVTTWFSSLFLMSFQVAPLKFLTANNSILGDVPKRLKGPDSKSGRSVLPALGFKSPHLRQKISGSPTGCACDFFI